MGQLLLARLAAENITIAESHHVPYYALKRLLNYALKRLLNHRTNGDVTGGYIVVTAERLRGW